MNRSLLIFKKHTQYFIAAAASLVLVFFVVNIASANGWTFADDFGSRSLGDLIAQDGWAITNYYGNPSNTVKITEASSGATTKDIEITNSDSLAVTRDIVPTDAGIFQFRMRHNKSGIFYFYALTSDAGGQLLFSIQFTETRGVLLEEGSEQVTLLPDYNANQWYLFTIDFDRNRGERGTIKIKIDDGSYSEYGYVNSESAVFDFAQMVFGSESKGTAISAFGDIKSASSAPAIIDAIDGNIPPEIASSTSQTTSADTLFATTTIPVDQIASTTISELITDISLVATSTPIVDSAIASSTISVSDSTASTTLDTIDLVTTPVVDTSSSIQNDPVPPPVDLTPQETPQSTPNVDSTAASSQ